MKNQNWYDSAQCSYLPFYFAEDMIALEQGSILRNSHILRPEAMIWSIYVMNSGKYDQKEILNLVKGSMYPQTGFDSTSHMERCHRFDSHNELQNCVWHMQQNNYIISFWKCSGTGYFDGTPVHVVKKFLQHSQHDREILKTWRWFSATDFLAETFAFLCLPSIVEAVAIELPMR